LKISEEDIEKVLKVKCSKHPKKIAGFLPLVPDVKNARSCNLCLKHIGLDNCLDIEEIFNEPEDRELTNYPVLAGITPNDIIKDESMESQMDSYFKELINQIEIKIEEKKEARK